MGDVVIGLLGVETITMVASNELKVIAAYCGVVERVEDLKVDIIVI